MSNDRLTRIASTSVGRRKVLAGAGAGALLASSPVFSIGKARAAGNFKLGVLLPRSGLLSLIGQGCQRGAELAVPILKDLGYQVELISADTESSPDVGRTQAEKLIREGAHMLMGCFDSATTAAVAQVAEQKGVPFVINIGADPKITEQGYKYVFRNFPTSVQLGMNGLKLYKDIFAAANVQPKTAALLHINDSFGMSMLNGINALFPKLDLPFQIVETIAYDPKARDLSVEVAKAKAAKPDIVMTVTRLNDAILLVREMVKQQFDCMGIISPGSPGMYERQFCKALGKYGDYAITNIPWANPTQALAKRLGEVFEKTYPDETNDLNIGMTFEGVLIAADAAKRANSTAPEELVKALRATKIENRVMVGDAITFNEKGQNPNQMSAAVQNQGGGPHVVLPKISASKSLLFPVPSFKSRG